MSIPDDGGSAFPASGSLGQVGQDGMTLLDYFAAQAMPYYLANKGIDTMTAVAYWSYKMARAMLDEREKNRE